MKMTSKILSFLIAATMFSTTAFAADVKFDDKVEYVTGENIEVSVYVTNEAITSIDGMTYAGIEYDSDALTFVEGKAGVITASEFADEGGIVYWEYNGTAAVAITDLSKPLFSLVFSVNEENLDADTAVSMSSDYVIGANNSSIQMDLSGVSVKVTKKSTEPVPGTVGEKDGYTTVVDDDKATRFVVTDTKASIAATAASVLKVTYAGETKQANLYKLLGVEAGATGDVTIGSLTIKMVLPATVQDAASIGAYSFIVE